MDTNYINESKENYAELLIANGNTKRANEVMKQDAYTPVFKIRESHPQAEPEVKDYNEMVMEAYVDLSALITGIRDCAQDYKDLMISTKNRLEAIKLSLLEEKEKQDDINILCNKFTDFNNVITFSTEDISGNYTFDQGIISAAVESNPMIDYTITSIDGNGYEGNDYVYKNNEFLNKVINTSNRDFIKDNSELTVYEYSRITANNSETDFNSDINLASIEAKCTITIASKSAFNKLCIKLSSKDTILYDLLTSIDGIKYTSVIDKPITIFSDYEKYNNKTSEYIYNSGIVCFPTTQFLKIVLQSNAITDDEIAFEKTNLVAVSEPTSVTATTDDFVYDGTTHKVINSSFS